MIISITGGSGLIGTALTKHLLEAGHKVIILSRSPGRVGDLPPGSSARKWHSSNPAANVPVMEESDAVVNLAGSSIMRRWTSSNREKILLSRVNTGRVLVASIREAAGRPAVLIQGSAFGYYGTGEERVDEEAGAGSGFLAEVSKRWERSTAETEEMGVRRVILRTGIVLSNRGGAFPLMKLPFRFFAGGALGSGRQWLSWIHMNDEAAAIRFLIENAAASGPFNLTSPRPVTNGQFSHLLGKAMNRPAWLGVPGSLIRMIMGETSTVALEGRPVIPRKLTGLGFRFKFPRVESALKDLCR
jgi:hypothetical protein